jgi:excisionase family DNA binding protein
VSRTTLRPRRLASVEDAASYANVSTRTVRRWISQGLIPGYRVGPRLVKVDLDDFDNLAVPIPTAGGGPNAVA